MLDDFFFREMRYAVLRCSYLENIGICIYVYTHEHTYVPYVCACRYVHQLILRDLADQLVAKTIRIKRKKRRRKVKKKR